MLFANAMIEIAAGPVREKFEQLLLRTLRTFGERSRTVILAKSGRAL